MSTHARIIAEKNTQFERRRREIDKESAIMRSHRVQATRQMRPASTADYAAFMAKRTIPCTHFYDYNMPGDEFFVASKDIDLPPLYGALSISVIALPGVRVISAGHCSVFSMDNPDAAGWVPSYNDANMG